MSTFNTNNIIGEVSDKDKKILAIYYPPPIAVFPHHIIPLSLLLANEKFSALIVNHYIQLSYNYYYDEHNINFLDINYFPIVFDFFPNLHFINRSTTYLKILELSNKEVEINQDSILDYIINWIDNGYYLYFNLDESQIPGTSYFSQKLQSLHPIFIFGYDKSNKILKSINYDQLHNVSVININFEDFKKSFVSPITRKLLNEQPWGKGLDYMINLFNRRDEANIELNISLIKDSLIDYVSSSNSALKYELFFPVENSMKWGIETYGAIESYLNNPKRHSFFDFRIFFGLSEHKKLMSNRIDCLEKNAILDPKKNLLAASKQMEEKADLLKMLSIKYRFKQDSKILTEIKTLLNGLKDMDMQLMENILSAL